MGVIPIGRLAGARTRRSGAVPRSRWAARRLRPNLTTATLGIRTGRPAGARTRRSGAAPRSRWAAPCPSHTIAMRGILIGRLDGVQTRRSGAAPTRRWGANRSVAIEHPAHEQAAGVRSRIEAACDVYVYN